MFSRIAVGVDRSQHAARALSGAIDLAVAEPGPADDPNGVAVALGHRFGDSGIQGVVTLAAEPAKCRVDDRCLGMWVGSRPGVAILLEQA